MSAVQADPRVVQSRRVILEAAMRVLLRNPDASISEISRESGVGRATLYRHFPTRDALLLTLARDCLEETWTELAPIRARGLSALETILASIDQLIPQADRFHFLMTNWPDGDGARELEAMYAEQLRFLMDLVRQAQADGDLDPSVPARWIVRCFDALVYQAWEMVQTGALDSSTAQRAMRQTFTCGFGAGS